MLQELAKIMQEMAKRGKAVRPERKRGGGWGRGDLETVRYRHRGRCRGKGRNGAEGQGGESDAKQSGEEVEGIQVSDTHASQLKGKGGWEANIGLAPRRLPIILLLTYE